MAKIKDMANGEIRNLIHQLVDEEEAKKRGIVKLIQSRCKHRRRGIVSQEGHNVQYCQDCNKIFYDKEI